MDSARQASTDTSTSLRWLARLSSLVIDSAFVLILILATTNEDKPHGSAIVVLALLVLVMVVSFTAWRWEKAGGALVVVGGLCLGVAALLAQRAFGLGSFGLLGAFVYGAPFVFVGFLFWMSGERARIGAAK
jgi:hypothetical protein